MASLAELEHALINADAAGDVDAARTLAGEITRMRSVSLPAATSGAGDLSVNNVVRSAATGVPIIGGALNQMNAATNAALAPLLNPLFSEENQLKGATFAERRAESLRQQQGMDRDFAAQHPVVDTAAQMAGGVAGTLPAVMAAPAAFGAGAGSIGARSLASMVSGGAIGGTDAAVRSGGDLRSTTIGGGLGTIIGAASPALSAGAGKVAAAIADRAGGFSKPTGALSALPKPAANYALETLGDPARQATLRADLDRLGPQAMLADVSPEWMGVARGAASQPGMRDEIAVPLLNRDAAKNARLQADMDNAIGAPPVPSQVEAGITAGQRDLGPQYGEVFRGARAVNTEPLAHAIEADAINMRGPAQRAAQQVRGMLDIHGAPGNLDPNPGTLFQTRQAIDGMLAGETNPQVIRTLSGYRQRVDDMLGQAVPGIKDVDAQFAELARQRDALGRGQQVLDSGRTAPRPQELAQEVQQGALPQGRMVGPSAAPLRMRQGARAELDRVVGTNANDPAALQRLVKSEGDWNRDRLRTLFGPRADDVLNSIDRETTFFRTNNRVTSGSDTAMANRFGDFLDQAATPSKIPTDSTITGMILRSAQKAGQKVVGANAEEKAARFAKDLGRLAVAQGPARDQIVQSLMDTARRRQSLDPINSAAREVARVLLASSPPAANRRLIEQ